MIAHSGICLIPLLLFLLIVRCNAVQESTIGFEGFNAKNSHNRIALTFDDGPHGTLTPKLLDILKEKNVKVTFFVMGVKVAMHPDIIQRAHAEGHEIANHVWDHPVLSKIPRDSVKDQIERTNTAIRNAIAITPKVMRPPYGNTNAKLNDFIYEEENLRVILWSHDTNDWKRPPVSEIVTKTIPMVKSGTVILCHDIHPGTIEAMPQLIDKLHEAGFKFATVSKLIEMNNNSAHHKAHHHNLRG